MKSLLVILSLTLSAASMASSIVGVGERGPFTTITSSGTTSAFNAKTIAIAVENDAQIYLQTGELSPILDYTVKNIRDQNSNLSVDEAVSIALEYAATQARN